MTIITRCLKEERDKIGLAVDRRCIQNVLGKIIEVVLDFRDREMYDKLSLNYVKSGCLGVIVKAIVLADSIGEPEYKNVARILELCACHS